jgi:hypothetical protein
MTDAGLLAFGCCVSFVVVAGAYVALRERWEADDPRTEALGVEAVEVTRSTNA